MAAIVATLLFWPIVVAVAFLLALFGVASDGLLTFGGALNSFFGLVAWWLVAFAAALVYAAFAFPWAQTHGFDGERRHE